jgi:hypothetical protein
MQERKRRAGMKRGPREVDESTTRDGVKARRAIAGRSPSVRPHRRSRGDPAAIGDRPLKRLRKAKKNAML